MRRVRALEVLVNERLKSDLERVLERRDTVYERIAHCLELRNNMRMLRTEQLSSLKTMVNLGCDFYVQASMCADEAFRAARRSCARRVSDPRAPPRLDPTRGGCTWTLGSASTRR